MRQQEYFYRFYKLHKILFNFSYKKVFILIIFLKDFFRFHWKIHKNTITIHYLKILT